MARGSCPGEGVLSLLPPSFPPLVPSGPPSPPRVGAMEQTPTSCLIGFLSAVPAAASGRERSQRYSQGSWDFPLHGSLMGEGTPAPIASSCRTASWWWGLPVAVSPLEQLPCIPQCPRGPRETHILATPTAAAPSLCSDISLQLFLLCSDGQRANEQFRSISW